MGASFPNGIASFPTHRNLYDDVDAADINRIQEEIVAIQTVLGALFNEVHTIEAEVTKVEAEQVADAARDASLEARVTADEAAETVLVTRFNNLKEQIAYIQSGQDVLAAEATCNNIHIPKIAKHLETANPRVLNLNPPPADKDPRQLFDGVGFTLRRSGFWLLQGHVRYDTRNGAGHKNYGMYQAAIGIGDTWARGMDRTQPVHDNIWANVFLNPVVFGYFSQGTRVTLRTAQSSEINQVMAQGWLSVVHLRMP